MAEHAPHGGEGEPRRFAGYSSAEAQATYGIVRRQHPGWRWLFPVTRATRDFFTGQFRALQVSYLVAVAQIFTAAYIDRQVARSLLFLWLMESFASFAVRWLLVGIVAWASPVQVAKRPLLRLCPLIAIVLGAVHWSWTAHVFIGARLDATVVVTLLSFVMLSVTIIGIAPASPILCLAYLAPLWLSTAYRLFKSNWAGTEFVMILLAALGAVLWASLSIVVSGTRRILVQGDEIDLLVTNLRDRNAEVEELRASAARQYAMRVEFFTSASHDFRQRLHAFKLLAHSQPSARQAAGQQVDRLGAAVEDLETYATEVLQFARFESLGEPPKRTVVRLQDIFQSMALQFEDIALERGVDLTVRTSSLRLHTDAAMLMRVLDNLVSNALRFTRRRVLLAARRRREFVCIEVWDQGPGIPQDAVERIFDAFYQSREPAGTTREGVGLGLAIVRRLTDALGYRVEVHSRLGRGTVMRVWVPQDDIAN